MATCFNHKTTGHVAHATGVGTSTGVEQPAQSAGLFLFPDQIESGHETTLLENQYASARTST